MTSPNKSDGRINFDLYIFMELILSLGRNPLPLFDKSVRSLCASSLNSLVLLSVCAIGSLRHPLSTQIESNKPYI